MLEVLKSIEELKGLKTDLYGKDFLLTWEKSLDEIKAIALIGETLKKLHAGNISCRIFDSNLGISIFRDQSTRTRFSFASACNLLGFAVSDLDETKSQIAHGETVRETANMISFLSDVIGIRDDLFIGEGNTYMREVANAVEEGFKEKVLPQRPMVVNLQCDIDHPTQTMSDLMYLKKTFGSFEELRGKKIAMTWAYSPSYGKPLSVPQGIIGLMTRFGMDVSLAHPKGYDLLPDVVERAGRQAEESGGSFQLTHSMDEAFKGADIVYPKSWAPFAVMEERTQLLRGGRQGDLAALEQRCLEENRKHVDWECTEEKMKLTKGGRAHYMHCLPADITGVSCEQGEVADSVFERYRLDTYHEAANKPFAIAAMILASKMHHPGQVLEALLSKKRTRTFI